MKVLLDGHAQNLNHETRAMKLEQVARAGKGSATMQGIPNTPQATRPLTDPVVVKTGKTGIMRTMTTISGISFIVIGAVAALLSVVWFFQKLDAVAVVIVLFVSILLLFFGILLLIRSASLTESVVIGSQSIIWRTESWKFTSRQKKQVYWHEVAAISISYRYAKVRDRTLISARILMSGPGLSSRPDLVALCINDDPFYTHKIQLFEGITTTQGNSAAMNQIAAALQRYAGERYRGASQWDVIPMAQNYAAPAPQPQSYAAPTTSPQGALPNPTVILTTKPRFGMHVAGRYMVMLIAPLFTVLTLVISLSMIGYPDAPIALAFLGVVITAALWFFGITMMVKATKLGSGSVNVGSQGISVRQGGDQWIGWDEIAAIGVSVRYLNRGGFVPVRRGVIIRLRIAGRVPGLPSRPDLANWRVNDESVPYTHRIVLRPYMTVTSNSHLVVDQAAAALHQYAGSLYTGVDWAQAENVFSYR